MNDAAQASRAGGPQAVRLLLPVWGQRYLRRFFEFSLPTMIAPGNIPALAATLPCTFVFLTSAQDAELIAEHPGYRYLRVDLPHRDRADRRPDHRRQPFDHDHARL